MKTCEGCGAEMGVVEAMRWGVCLPCTMARAKAATTGGKCKCGRKRRPREASNGLGRRWLACDRCLGSIRQLS